MVHTTGTSCVVFTPGVCYDKGLVTYILPYAHVVITLSLIFFRRTFFIYLLVLAKWTDKIHVNTCSYMNK